jgi:CTP synthase (UTP-ammonia lyase)
VRSIRIAIIGDYNPEYISHPQTGGAVAAAGRRAGIDAECEWVGTETIATNGVAALDAFDGAWMAPGGPYRSLDGALAGIRHVREGGKPFVGT